MDIRSMRTHSPGRASEVPSREFVGLVKTGPATSWPKVRAEELPGTEVVAAWVGFVIEWDASSIESGPSHHGIALIMAPIAANHP